jgi:hypothetical protein
LPVGGVVCAALCVRLRRPVAPLFCRAGAVFGAVSGAAVSAVVARCGLPWRRSCATVGVFWLPGLRRRCSAIWRMFVCLLHVTPVLSAVSWPRAGPGLSVSLLRLCSRSCASWPVWLSHICRRLGGSSGFSGCRCGSVTDGLLRTRFVRLAASRCDISWAVGWWVAIPFPNYIRPRPAGAAIPNAFEGS